MIQNPLQRIDNLDEFFQFIINNDVNLILVFYCFYIKIILIFKRELLLLILTFHIFMIMLYSKFIIKVP